MNINFFASKIATDPIDGIWRVAFSDPAQEIYFLIQRDVENVLQARGLDIHYIEFGSQSRACYGGLEKVQVLRDAVRFHLTSDAAKRIGVSDIVVSFSVSKAELGSISFALAHIVEHGRVEVM